MKHVPEFPPVLRPAAAGLLLALCGLVATSVPSPGALIGYWKFDEGTGTTTADSSGRATPLNGTLSSGGAGLPLWTPGRFGNGLNFNVTAQATPTAGGLVTVPYNSDLRLSNAFTISFWWRPDYVPAASTFPGIVRIGNQTTVPAAGWGYYRSQPNIPTHKRGNHQPAVYSAMTVGAWHHIALTHDGAGNNIAFQNGVMVNFTTNWPGINTTANLEFGRMDAFDDAGLDDVALFNEQVSLAKVRSLYTVPNSLLVNYDLAKMRSLWAIFDGGSGSSGVIDGTTWTYTTTFPGSTTLGDAYLNGVKWYVVLGAGAGLSATATFLGDLSPGGIGAIGTLAFTETPMFGASARLVFDLGATTTEGAGVNDLLTITGDLNLSGNSVVVNPLAPLATGTYRLINYSGTKSGSFNPTVIHNSRYTVTLDETTPGQINLVVSGSNGDVDWFSASSGAWDLATFNWSNTVAMASDRFQQADSVSFDDSGAFQTNITLSLDVYPQSLTLNSDTRNYAFTGSGRIGGLAGGLAKAGSSLLTLSTPNHFLGPVNVNGGVLRLGNASALGATNSGTTIASGATLDLAGVVPGTEAFTVAGPGVSSTGAVINTGAALVNNGLRGPITLTGDTTFGGVNRWDVFGAVFNGGGFKLTKTGPPEIALSNLGESGLGDIDVLQGQLTVLGTTLMGNPAKAVSVSPGATLAHWASGTNIHNKPLNLNGARLLNGTSPTTDVATNVATVTLIGTNSVDGAANVALLGEITGAGALTKIGAGTVRLAGTNTYAGPTTVSAGTLLLVGNGSISNSASINVGGSGILDVTTRGDGTLTVSSNQLLAGTGTIRGSVAAGTGAVIGAGASPGTLTITNALNLSAGAVLNFELNTPTTAGGGINDLLNVGGALNLSGTTTLNILPIGNLTLGSPYTLISYAGPISGGAANFTATSASRLAFAVDTTTVPGKVLVTASGAPLQIEWVGGLDGNMSLANTWDTTNAANWLGGVFGDKFFAGDTVVFNDFASLFDVTLAGDLYPAATSVEADVSDYTFTGPGRIRGGGLTKTLAGKLTLANTGINDYPGPTLLLAGGGTLQVGNGGTFGNLGPGPITNDATLVFNRSDDLTLANTVAGSGTLRKDGANQLFLGASMAAFNGTISATGGRLRPTVATGLGTATGGTIIGAGAALEINAITFGAEPVTVAGAGPDGNGALVNNSATGQNNAFRFVTLTGDTTVGGVGRFDVRANPDATFVGNGFNLTKKGANQFSLVSVGETGLGDIQVQQGLLSVEGTTGLGPTGTLIVESGATAMLWGNTVSQAKNFALNNGGRLFKDNGTATILGTGTLTGSNAVEAASNAGADFTLGGVISGAGSLNKLGAGNVFLTANNDYSGGTLVSAGNLFLGNGGTAGAVSGSIIANATLTVFRSDAVTLANTLTGPGNLNVRTPAGLILDGSSSVTLGGTVNVGQDSFGMLVIQPGATPNVGSVFLGNPANISGVGVQLGGTLTVTNQFRVGHWPNEVSGYLLGGGTLTLSGTPVAVVNQAGATEQAGIIYLGIDGIGIFTQTGGVASAHGIVLDARGNTAALSGTNETFNLEGGTFTLGPSGIKSGSLDANTSYQINLGGGTLSASADWASSRLMTLTGTNGDVTFDTAGRTITLTGVLSGPGGLKKSGAGTLRLMGTNTFTGTTLVQAGILDGTGTLAGPLVVAPGGTVAPGTSIGTLTVNNTVVLDGTTVMEISKTGGNRTNDQITGSSRIEYGGTLTVLASGDPLADGDTFKLFSGFSVYSYHGAFDTVNLPALDPGLVWDLSQLPINGTIRVTDNLPPVPGAASISTVRNRTVSYSTIKLLDLASDPEGNPISFVSVNSGTNGGVVAVVGDRIQYTPLPDYVGVDHLAYVLADNQGGLSLGQIEVLIYPGNTAGLNILGIVPVGDDFQFSFAGIPGRTYAIERAAAVNGPWTQIASVVCDANGLTTFLDTDAPPGASFYRTVDLTTP